MLVPNVITYSAMINGCVYVWIAARVFDRALLGSCPHLITYDARALLTGDRCLPLQRHDQRLQMLLDCGSGVRPCAVDWCPVSSSTMP